MLKLYVIDIIDFNSTMVRLKEKKQKAFLHQKRLFQFHYGTIKRQQQQQQQLAQS